MDEKGKAMNVINSEGDSPPNQQQGVIYDAEVQQTQKTQKKSTTQIREKKRKSHSEN